MKILLDECLPRRLRTGFPVTTATRYRRHRLAAKKNGELLAIAERQGFEIFLTMDKGLQYEQNLAGRQIAVIIVRAKSNRLADLVALVEACLIQMRSIKPGQIARIGE